MICPHRQNRCKAPTRDRRALRRYRQRRNIEPAFARLDNLRRLVVRHERSLPRYNAFFHAAVLVIVLRHL